jgi:predicted HTH domain antitoxin
MSMSRRWFWFWLFLSLGKASRFVSMKLNQMEGALPERTPTLRANAGYVSRRKASTSSR